MRDTVPVRVLVVEDERRLAAAVKRGLEASGFVVDVACDGVTGLHMAHVTIGLIYLAIIAQGILRGKFKAEDVEVSGLYWHFVDLVWMFIFPLVYLMSVSMGD